MNLKLYFTCLIFFSSVFLFAQVNEPENEAEKCEGRKYYEQLKFRDPETGYIPENIRGMELAYSRNLNQPLYKRQPIAWTSRGPANIGGRTCALGIDISNEAILLAGSTAGGMWRSTDSGATWTRTTPLSEIPNVTCLVQDHRSGKTNTWYYGTGESGGNTGAYPLWLNNGPFKWGDYYGNGIYKSTDNGLTWNVLASTRNDTIGSLVQPFSFVNRIAVDNSKDTLNILYAAVAGGIERSTDGGQTWNMVLGIFPPAHVYTDVAVTSTGVVYAVLCNSRYIDARSTTGLYRSVNGTDWVKISSGWVGYFYGIPAIAPSNENVLYLVSNDSLGKATVWKYTYLNGDGSGSGGLFENRSANTSKIQDYFSIAAVHPENENVLYAGGVRLYRSNDGFATGYNLFNIRSPHVDQQAICFYKNANRMLVGSDGGVYRLGNNMSSSPWTDLNSNYLTSQFYTIAVDHYNSGDPAILGGMQDNNTYMTHSSDPKKKWTFVYDADGATCAFSKLKDEYFVSYQYGFTVRRKFNISGYSEYTDRIDPVGSGKYLFINPFIIDPNNADRMYFGGGNFIWRHDSLPMIPHNIYTSLGWKKLSNTTISEIDTVVKQASVSAIAVSEFPPDIVYYGSTDGQVYRVDKANLDNPSRTNIWSGKGFPANAFVSAISIDSRNADRVLLAFANYNVQSLFYTEDAGKTWTAVGGNLEEFSSGKGSGPSIRSVKILHGGDNYIYLVGTSTGLYSANKLNGMSTVWTLEGKDVIGNSIVNAIDARESDGFVAVATYGIGVFSGNFEPNTSQIRELHPENEIILYPNPSNGSVLIKANLKESLKLNITNSIGETVLPEQMLTESLSNIDISALPGGIYYMVFFSENLRIIKKLVVE